MAKVRVYELAKELGVESKTVLSMLKDMGEFVRSASSTVEAPVERRLKEKLASEPPPRPRRQQRKQRPQRRPSGAGSTRPLRLRWRWLPKRRSRRASAATELPRQRHQQLPPASAAGSPPPAAADAGSATKRAASPGQAAPAARIGEAPGPAPRPRPGSTGGLPGAPAARRPGTPRPAITRSPPRKEWVSPVRRVAAETAPDLPDHARPPAAPR